MTHAARTHDVFERLQAMREEIDALMTQEHERMERLERELIAAKCTTALRLVSKCRLDHSDKAAVAAALSDAVQALKGRAA